MTQAALTRIEASEQRVGDIFSDKYTFTIPPYQRPYAWELEQARDLLDDFLEAMQPGSGVDGFYFLGSVVLVKKPDDPDAKIVDGQQRLTTLTILFSVLRDLTSDTEKSLNRGSLIEQAANEDRGLKARLRLQLRERDQAFFSNHIQRRGATDELPRLDGLEDSEARMIENAAFFRKRLTGLAEEERDRLVAFILQRCVLVAVAVPTDAAARRIFRVLHTRGLDLTASDILKANLLERAGEARERVLADRWDEIELDLGRDRFVELFGHIRMIHQREKPRSALEEGFPEFVPPFREDPERFISTVLEPYAKAFSLVEDKAKLLELFDLKTLRLIQSLERLDNKDWLPPLILKLRQFRDNSKTDAKEFIFRLERLAYFLFVTRADVNSRMARYADVLAQIAPLEGKAAKSGGLHLSKEEEVLFLQALNGPLYTHSRICRPVVLRLDQALADESVTYNHSVITVEHVCPQTIAEGSQWAAWFPDQTEHQNWVHRLANLVLLSKRKNSAAGNWDFEKKKAAYFTVGGVAPFAVTTQVLMEDRWTAEVLKARQRALLDRLADDWQLDTAAIAEPTEAVE